MHNLNWARQTQQKHAELNEFLQQRAGVDVWGEHVIDAAMQHIERLEQSLTRYYVFGVDNFYPAGGMDDLILATSDLAEAKRVAANSSSDYTVVFDNFTGAEVKVKQ